MFNKKIKYFIEENNLDRKRPYTAKELSEQGFMAAGTTSSSDETVVETNVQEEIIEVASEPVEVKEVIAEMIKPYKNALVELKEEEKNSKVDSKKSTNTKTGRPKKENTNSKQQQIKKEVKKAAKTMDVT